MGILESSCSNTGCTVFVNIVCLKKKHELWLNKQETDNWWTCPECIHGIPCWLQRCIYEEIFLRNILDMWTAPEFCFTLCRVLIFHMDITWLCIIITHDVHFIQTSCDVHYHDSGMFISQENHICIIITWDVYLTQTLISHVYHYNMGFSFHTDIICVSSIYTHHTMFVITQDAHFTQNIKWYSFHKNITWCYCNHTACSFHTHYMMFFVITRCVLSSHRMLDYTDFAWCVLLHTMLNFTQMEHDVHCHHIGCLLHTDITWCFLSWYRVLGT